MVLLVYLAVLMRKIFTYILFQGLTDQENNWVNQLLFFTLQP